MEGLIITMAMLILPEVMATTIHTLVIIHPLHFVIPIVMATAIMIEAGAGVITEDAIEINDDK